MMKPIAITMGDPNGIGRTGFLTTPLPQLIKMARDALAFLPQQDQEIRALDPILLDRRRIVLVGLQAQQAAVVRRLMLRRRRRGRHAFPSGHLLSWLAEELLAYLLTKGRRFPKNSPSCWSPSLLMKNR